MRINSSVISLLLASAAVGGVLGKGPCDSQIYCEGDLLYAVQMAKLYPDDKTFVDKPTIRPEKEVLHAFAKIGGRNATRSQLKEFVDTYFGKEGQELKKVKLTELNPNPPFLSHIKDRLLREFGKTVNGYWSTLVRKQDLSSLCKGCATSMLPLKYHFVVPGGRFREIYYWDTYFSMEGMLRSGLNEVTKSNLKDLLAFVDMYGFVPNGARKYYLDRSQPPFLSLMAKIYFEHTKDLAFVRDSLPLLEKEHKYWQNKHIVKINVSEGNYTSTVWLNRYIVDTNQPRPESYTDDYELAHNVSQDISRQASVYADMATGAETGWDYSTRWVSHPHAPKDKILYGIRTRQVVPVELNGILYQVEQALAEFSDMVGASSKAKRYRQMATQRKDAMQKVFLDKAKGLYFDYILDEHKRSNILSPASLWPYWSFGKEADPGKNAFDVLSRIMRDNSGGVPATLIDSGQQWDFPSVWPPLQYVLMQAALNTKHNQLATELAQKYVNDVFCAWYETGGSILNVLNQLPNQTDSGHMFEKFDATQVGQPGGGGEYTVQAGFGWTNGVLLWALDTFGSKLSTPVCPGANLNIVGNTSPPVKCKPRPASTTTS